LKELDFGKPEELKPSDDVRKLLLDWLEYQRIEFRRTLRDLTPEGLAEWSVPPVELSVLGLVRHMSQMEHFDLAWGLGAGDRFDLCGDGDFAGGSVETVDSDLETYLDQVDLADRAVAKLPSLDSRGLGRGGPLAATPDRDDRRVRPPRRAGAHAQVRRPRRHHSMSEGASSTGSQSFRRR
jgi:hypothetical protein